MKEQWEDMWRVYAGIVRDAAIPKTTHILWMFYQMNDMLEEDFEKFSRWLGFVQGYLWTNDLRSIEEMQDDTRKLVAARKEKLASPGPPPKRRPRREDRSLPTRPPKPPTRPPAPPSNDF